MRYLSTLRLNLNNQFTVKLPAILGTRKLKIVFYQLWQGRKHAITRRL